MTNHTNPKEPNTNPTENQSNNQQESTKRHRQTPAQKNEKVISSRQFFFFIIQTQIGVGILSLPNELHQVAKQDGWISLLIGGTALLVVIFVMWLTAKTFPDKNLFQILMRLFTKWPGKIISLIYTIYFIGVSILIILLFARMISLWVLPNTPFWVFALILIVIGSYLTNGGLMVIARLYTMVSFLLSLLVVLIIFSMQEVHIMYLLPMGGAGLSKIMLGAFNAILSFLGFYVSLVVYPKVKGTDKEKLRAMLYAQLFVMFYYLFAILACYTFFSTKEISVVPEPLLFMLKSFELQVIARIDLFFISIWIVSVATSFTTYIYVANIGVREIFNTKRKNIINAVICTIVLFVSMYFGFDMLKVEKYADYTVKTGFVLAVIAPFVYVILGFIVKKVEKRRKSA